MGVGHEYVYTDPRFAVLKERWGPAADRVDADHYLPLGMKVTREREYTDPWLLRTEIRDLDDRVARHWVSSDRSTIFHCTLRPKLLWHGITPSYIALHESGVAIAAFHVEVERGYRPEHHLYLVSFWPDEHPTRLGVAVSRLHYLGLRADVLINGDAPRRTAPAQKAKQLMLF